MLTPPRPFVALAGIALIEGVALLGYGLFDAIEAIRVGATGPEDVSNGPAIALQIVLFAIFGAGLVWIARGWWSARRWARAPFLLAQLLALLVGYDISQGAGAERFAGVALAIVAALGIVLVFTPAVMRQLDAE